jgi:hypothetical protein
MAKLYRIAINQGENKIGFAYRNRNEFKEILDNILDSVDGFDEGDTEIRLSVREENENE